MTITIKADKGESSLEERWRLFQKRGRIVYISISAAFIVTTIGCWVVLSMRVLGMDPGEVAQNSDRMALNFAYLMGLMLILAFASLVGILFVLNRKSGVNCPHCQRNLLARKAWKQVVEQGVCPYCRVMIENVQKRQNGGSASG